MWLGEHKEVERGCLVSIGSCNGQRKHAGWQTLSQGLVLVLLLSDMLVEECLCRHSSAQLSHHMRAKLGALEMLLQ